METRENSDEVVFKHTPVREWILGGISALVFIGLSLCIFYFVFISPIGLVRYGADDIVITLLVFIIPAAVAVFVFTLRKLHSPLTIITISEKTKSVDILHRRFYGERMERFYFLQIRNFSSHKHPVTTANRYCLAFVLENGRMIKFKVLTGEKKETVKLIRKLNKIIKATYIQAGKSLNKKMKGKRK